MLLDLYTLQGLSCTWTYPDYKSLCYIWMHLDYRSLCCSWTCLHYRGICCTCTCLFHRALSFTWTCVDNRSLFWSGHVFNVGVWAVSERVLTIGTCSGQDVSSPWGTWATPGCAWTTGAFNAPRLVHTTGPKLDSSTELLIPQSIIPEPLILEHIIPEPIMGPNL